MSSGIVECVHVDEDVLTTKTGHLGHGTDHRGERLMCLVYAVPLISDEGGEVGNESTIAAEEHLF